jgi:hypothetical protein
MNRLSPFSLTIKCNTDSYPEHFFLISQDIVEHSFLVCHIIFSVDFIHERVNQRRTIFPPQFSNQTFNLLYYPLDGLLLDVSNTVVGYYLLIVLAVALEHFLPKLNPTF